MSEADNAWRIDVQGRQHDIDVEHSTLTGKIVVRQDGKVVAEDRLVWSKKDITLDVGGHVAELSVDFAYGGFAAKSRQRLDGRHVIWRCWQDGVAYDPAQHRALQTVLAAAA